MRIQFGQKIIDIFRLKFLKFWLLKKNNPDLYEQYLYPQLGKHSYIGRNCLIGSANTTIGKYCSISRRVEIGPTSHPKNALTTHPFVYFDSDLYSISIPDENKLKYNFDLPCHIGNDVWIGVNSVIMDGITVGDGAIIGANSTITKDVPPYAIVVGANRIIGYRFSPEIIKQLLELKWWDLDEKYLYDLPFNDINECIKKLKAIRESLK